MPILTPSRASISAMRRGIVQLGRSATGASSRGATTRSAASVFTGGGPGDGRLQRLDTAARELAAPKIELDGVPADIAHRAFELAQAKLPIKTRIVARVEEAV